MPDSTTGEVVVTPLGVQGMALLRFKTGDISYIINETCACGRTTRRSGPAIGSKAQLLKFKGTNFTVYDSQSVFHELLVKFMELIFDRDVLDVERILQ